MATYTGSLAVIATITPLDNTIRSNIEFGIHGAIDFNGEELYTITLKHPLILKSEVATLLTFWNTNKYLLITTQTLGDGNTYDGYLMHEPLVDNVSEFRKNVTQKILAKRN